MFTRKHYTFVSEHYNNYTDILKHTLSDDALDVLENYIISLSLELEQDNPNFKRDLFLKACGL